jgi:hypothetical protein
MRQCLLVAENLPHADIGTDLIGYRSAAGTGGRGEGCRSAGSLSAVILAIEGQDAVTIAKSLGRSRRSVQDWAYAYRDGGIDTI